MIRTVPLVVFTVSPSIQRTTLARVHDTCDDAAFAGTASSGIATNAAMSSASSPRRGWSWSPVPPHLQHLPHIPNTLRCNPDTTPAAWKSERGRRHRCPRNVGTACARTTSTGWVPPDADNPPTGWSSHPSADRMIPRRLGA